MPDRQVVVILRKMIPGTDWVVSSVTEITDDIELQYRSPETFAEEKMNDERNMARKTFYEFDQQQWKYVVMPLNNCKAYS